MTTSRGALFGGKVAFEQPARGAGYRVNVDAILLAAFAARVGAAKGSAAKAAYDLGAGAGGVALSLLHFGAARKVVLVEVDAHAAQMAERNLAANGWTERGHVVIADAREAARAHAAEADLVVCNPPYFASGRGRAAREPARAAARSGELRPFVDAARALLGRRARGCFVYPARELATLFETLRAAGLEPKRMRLVHASEGEPARVAMIEAMHAKRGGLIVEPPLIERASGGYSPELAALLSAK